MSESTTVQNQQFSKPEFSRKNLRRMLPGIVANWVVPAAAYGLLRPHLGSDIEALIISAAIPVLITLVMFVIRRKVNVLGLIAVVGFALSLAVSVFTGGSELAFKLQDPALTGLIGLVFLASVAIGHPLHLVIARLRTQRGLPPSSPVGRRRASILSALFGATFLVHGAAVTVLALTVPTSTFLALSRPVGLPVLVIGIGLTYWYARRSGQKAVSPIPETEISR